MGRKKQPGVKRTEPGRAVLDENLTWVTGSMSLRKQERVYRGPMVADAANASMRDVEGRVIRAMKTLRSLPDRERRFFGIKSGHPPHVQEQIDAYASVEAMAPRFTPTPFDVSDYLRALSWTRHLPKHQWKIIWWRSFGLSFGLIAQYIGQSDETARRKYREAITDAWTAANSVAARGAA